MALGISHVGPPMMRHVWGKPSQQSLALTAQPHTHTSLAWHGTSRMRSQGTCKYAILYGYSPLVGCTCVRLRASPHRFGHR